MTNISIKYIVLPSTVMCCSILSLSFKHGIRHTIGAISVFSSIVILLLFSCLLSDVVGRHNSAFDDDGYSIMLPGQEPGMYN